MEHESLSQDLRRKMVLQQAAAQLERGELHQAEASLSRVLAEIPGNAQALHLFGIVRRAQGRLAEAEELYRRSLSTAPEQAQVHYNLGNLLRSLNRLEESIAEQREAIRLKPNHSEAHLALALALSMTGDHASAEKSCRDALRLQPNYTAAKLAIAGDLCALNRPKEAERILRQALTLGVREPALAAALEHNLGLALKQQRRFLEALASFDAAQAKAPELPVVDYSRGNTLQQLGRLEEAARAYRQALKRDPRHIDALACLALVSALLTDFAAAQSFAAQALELDQVQPIARIARAIVAIEAGQFAEAETTLDNALKKAAVENDRQAMFAAGFAADAFDRHGRISDAFAVYSTSNEMQRRIHASEFEPARVIGEVTRLTDYFRKSLPWPPHRSVARAKAPAGHVFLLGFMRSGTTLLETILAMNPRAAHIDEIEFLSDPSRRFLLSSTGLDQLAMLGDREADQWRNAYWKSIRDAGLSVDGKVFVDKMPFNTLRLPLISRLFPSAKIIFAIRDPRDVVFSCFRRRFNPSPYSFEFFRLDDCARFYAAAMDLAELYREKLPLDLREHRYEDMITNFESSVRAVCDFIGLEWSDAMGDFSTAAHAIDRTSASAAQVRRGLYGEGIGQWRRYSDQLASVYPILAPWVARFGYPAD
ncbi:MAG TPA: sulfotransferase [Rhizomicrobium sp.]|nr:sulfotransferase [Rhizomicrobium sp.]